MLFNRLDGKASRSAKLGPLPTARSGVFYLFLTGRSVLAVTDSVYEPMVYIGLGCVLSLVGGLYVGRYLIRRLKPPVLHPRSAQTNPLTSIPKLASACSNFCPARETNAMP